MMNQTYNLKEFHDEVLKWLVNSDIIDDNGVVYSWTNPEKPGYVYMEIIGYYVKLMSYLYKNTKDQQYLEKAIKSADYLSNNLNENGSVSRYDVEYVFDSAICISGMIALSKVKELSENQEKALRKLLDFVYTSLLKKNVAFKDGEPLIDLDRWSLSYGSLLIKNCMALYEAYEYFDDIKYKDLALNLAKELIDQCFKEGHFNINGERNFVYTHPHCYATEGLLFLSSKGIEFDDVVMKAAEWLASNQNEDGSLSSFYYKNVELTKQGDATSQAVRIWSCVDKEKFIDNIGKGIEFLKTLQSDKGGLVYNEGSADVNSWVSIFTLQALYWQFNQSEKEWLL